MTRSRFSEEQIIAIRLPKESTNDFMCCRIQMRGPANADIELQLSRLRRMMRCLSRNTAYSSLMSATDPFSAFRFETSISYVPSSKVA